MQIGILAHTISQHVDEDEDWRVDVAEQCGLCDELIDLAPHMQGAPEGAKELDIPTGHSYVWAPGFPEAFTVEIIVRVRMGAQDPSEVVYR